jgi:predicted Rossmann-fold nucleotide-binding protein
MYQSAKGASNSKITESSLFTCYPYSLFDKSCDTQALMELSINLRGIALVPNESIRKSYLVDPSDVVIALPGAMGTFSEIVASLYMGKKVILCNIWREERSCYYWQGFYDLLQQHGLTNNVQLVNISPSMSYEEVFREMEKATININLDDEKEVTSSEYYSKRI